MSKNTLRIPVVGNQGLNKFYNYYMATVVVIIVNGHGHSISMPIDTNPLRVS